MHFIIFEEIDLGGKRAGDTPNGGFAILKS